MTRPDDNVPYYAYVLLYVDDCMAISHDAATTLREIDKFFPMKPGSIGDPDVYLGGKLRKIKLPNGIFVWANSSSRYVQEIVANVEKHIGQNLGGRKLNKRAEVPWPSNYAAEDDTTPELDEEWANYYQPNTSSVSFIGHLNLDEWTSSPKSPSSHHRWQHHAWGI